MIILDASALYPLAKQALRNPERIAKILVENNAALLDLTLYEATNAAVIEARRKLIKNLHTVVNAVKELAEQLELIRIDPSHTTHIAKLAEKLRLTAYDAAYIYYARMYRAKLVTEDKEILSKARDVAITIRELVEMTSG